MARCRALLTRLTSPPTADWWLEAYVRTARKLEGNTQYEPRNSEVAHYKGPVNDPKDNDTIAAIVGAAIGAMHGRSGLPSRWIDNLLGRTADSDNGRILKLLESARRRWWMSKIAQIASRVRE